ncbi:MAG TPA: gamma-glutamylcyclotransferase family protein [Polyangiaceae bacterium]|nr:gamma-glutamylcyclotransferase family protein [Polyangiaceae bacterium]
MTAAGEARLLFVYGSLKRGFSNHRLLAGARFVGECRTEARYQLLVLGIYPALSDQGDRAIAGELYALDARQLSKLDEFEGEAYRRRAVQLEDGRVAEAYFLVPERRAQAAPDPRDRWL